MKLRGLLFFIFLGVILPLGASAYELYLQNNSDTYETSRYGSSQLYQLFTPTVSGTLYSVSFYGIATTTGMFGEQESIYNGALNTVLASSASSWTASTSTSPQWFTIQFPSGLAVTQGVTYGFGGYFYDMEVAVDTSGSGMSCYSPACSVSGGMKMQVDTELYPTIGVPPPVSNVDFVQPTAPINATSTFSTIIFQGTYTNGYDPVNYDNIVAEINNISISQQSVATSSIAQSGIDINFSFPYFASTTGSFTYRMKLQDSTTASSSIWSTYYNFGIDTSLQNPPTGTTTPVITCDPVSGFLQNSLCNLVVFLFSPSSNVFDKFSTLKDDLKYHAPFGYFTSAYTEISNLNGSTTPAFILQQVTPITTYIFTPLRTSISWLLWFFALVFLYKRLTNIHI